PALDLSEAFANAAEAVTPAVVRIEVTTTLRNRQGMWPFIDPQNRGGEAIPVQSGGSGFLMSEDGYVLTNNHVVEDANEIRVYLTDGRYFIADLVGADPTTDVAVVKIDETGLPFLSLGSSENLRVGEWVLAIGNPGIGGDPDDLDYTVTAGIVSALGRPLTLIRNELFNDPEFGSESAGFAIEDYIQTDAVINRGNSGGPMVNIMGQVVGINSAISSPTGTYVGYGFAIPIDLASRVMEDLIEYGRVRRAWLGVSIEPIAPEDSEIYDLPAVAGVLIQGVTEGGPAEDVGLRQSDVLYSVDGEVVYSPNGLQNLIAQKRPGVEVSLRIYRDGSPRDLQVRLGEAPLNSQAQPMPEPEEPASEEKLGITVAPLTEEFLPMTGYEEAGGVIITGVTRLGPADRRGVARGLKLLSIDNEPIETPDDVRRVLRGVESGEVVSLVLGDPDGGTRVVNVRAGR
ncbi:MAG: trypsin-like peptidase domain-containing protein, partial [Gemmatimonadota bacterium]